MSERLVLSISQQLTRCTTTIRDYKVCVLSKTDSGSERGVNLSSQEARSQAVSSLNGQEAAFSLP